MKTPKSIAVCTAAVLLLAGVVTALADGTLVDALKKRYPVSRIEVQNAAVQGTVTRPGARLRLEADDVPAKPFHVTQINTNSPRFHVRDYAQVDAAAGKLVTLTAGALKLHRGTELVVLDIRVSADTVRLFTHTSELVGHVDGRRAFGCTEFVFRFDHALTAPADAALVQQTIERWLSPAS